MRLASFRTGRQSVGFRRFSQKGSNIKLRRSEILGRAHCTNQSNGPTATPTRSSIANGVCQHAWSQDKADPFSQSEANVGRTTRVGVQNHRQVNEPLP